MSNTKSFTVTIYPTTGWVVTLAGDRYTATGTEGLLKSNPHYEIYFNRKCLNRSKVRETGEQPNTFRLSLH